MDAKQKKKIIAAYKDLLQFYFKTGRREPDLDDKPFTNFLDLIHPILLKHKFYCNDIFLSSINWHLEGLSSLPSNVDEQQLDNVIEHINKSFEINKEKHYLIFPLQGSGLKKDISFSKFHILKEKSEEELHTQISDITSIDKKAVIDFLEHTKNSRSKGFLKSNIMIIEVENQTENVRYSAYQLAQYSVNFLFLIHSAFGMKSSSFRKPEIWRDENRHVAILSKDGWRCGHGHSWDAHLQCKLDIDFMEEDKYQQIFDKLFSSFALRIELNNLAYKFINLFMLYSRGIVQRKIHHDDSLALLLFITALESLITEGQQEKRLRLAVIIPKLITIDGMTSFELATMIDELYKDRNNFVHAGQTPSYSYKNNKLETLERVTALMILKYFEVDSLLDVSLGQTRVKAWTEYLNELFNSIIFGKEKE
jgi:hypothetical protein